MGVHTLSLRNGIIAVALLALVSGPVAAQSPQSIDNQQRIQLYLFGLNTYRDALVTGLARLDSLNASLRNPVGLTRYDVMSLQFQSVTVQRSLAPPSGVPIFARNLTPAQYLSCLDWIIADTQQAQAEASLPENAERVWVTGYVGANATAVRHYYRAPFLRGRP